MYPARVFVGLAILDVEYSYTPQGLVEGVTLEEKLAATRKKYSAEEKIRIIQEELRGKATECSRLQVWPDYYLFGALGCCVAQHFTVQCLNLMGRLVEDEKNCLCGRVVDRFSVGGTCERH